MRRDDRSGAPGDRSSGARGGRADRFCALAAALAVRSRRATVVDERRARRYLAAQPVSLLRFRGETEALVEPLSRLGVRTLGELAALARDAVADRFGAPAFSPIDLPAARTRRCAPEASKSAPGGGNGAGGVQLGAALERVLGVLVDRLLARPSGADARWERWSLSARLVEGGTWRERVVFRQALADGRRMRLALSLRLVLLPAPAEALRLGVARFGPPDGKQNALPESDHRSEIGRQIAAMPTQLSELRAPSAPRCAPRWSGASRAPAGGHMPDACDRRQDAALHALCVDLDSRVPERRVVLSTFSG